MANPISYIRSKISALASRGRNIPVTNMWGMSTIAVYPTVNVDTAIQQGFKTNTAVYSIIKRASKKFGSIPRYVESKKTAEKKAEDADRIEGKLADLLYRPNPMQGQDAFFSLLYAFYKVTGEGFIWLNRGDTGVIIDDEVLALDDKEHEKKPVLEMYVLPSNRVTIIPDPVDPFGIIGYQLTDRPDIKFRKVDIIHWKDINLDWDLSSRPQLRGYSPLVAGLKTLEQNNSATDGAVRMYQNSGAKGALLNELSGTPTQQTQVTDVLDNKINNIEHKGAVVALQGKWTYENFGLTSVDMELLEGKKLSMQELCFLMGMPYEFFDSQVTYANKSEAQKGWVINEIMPDCKQLDGEMNRMLLKSFGLESIGVICSDFDDLAELQEDRKTQIEWLMKGPFTINEIREAVGYDDSTEDGADEIIIPSGYSKLSDLTGDGGGDIMTQVNKLIKPSNGANANGRANIGNGKG